MRVTDVRFSTNCLISFYSRNANALQKEMPPQANGQKQATTVNIPDNAVQNLTVEEMYDKEKYDLSTMEEGDVFKMLE